MLRDKMIRLLVRWYGLSYEEAAKRVKYIKDKDV